MKILVTGFQPFGGRRSNPSEWIARRLRGVVPAVLPVTWRGAERRLLALLRRHRPDAVVALGLASSSARLRLEMVALNVDHAEAPDNARERRARRKIAPRGPWVRETRLPVDAILAAWRRARVPGGVSYHAGTYVCNHVFYVLLGATRVPAGFIHVPPRAKARSLRGVQAAVDVLANL